MAEYAPRSYLRNSNGPQAVESSWSYGRYDDRSQRRSKKTPGEKKHKSKDTTLRHRSIKAETRPVFRLDVLSQPSSNIVLGMDVGMTVLLSLQFSEPELVPRSVNNDTSRLLAMASLVAETRQTERKPMECGSIVGANLADSLHQVPRQFQETFKQSHPCRLIIGYFSLSELVIRQSGYYRIRATVLQAPPFGSCSAPSTVVVTDSDLIKVDRRPTAYKSRLA